MRPDTVQVPVPALVSPPDPVPRILARLLPLAEPSSVRVYPLPVMVPPLERMILPDDAFTVLLLISFRRPL